MASAKPISSAAHAASPASTARILSKIRVMWNSSLADSNHYRKIGPAWRNDALIAAHRYIRLGTIAGRRVHAACVIMEARSSHAGLGPQSLVSADSLVSG